MFLSQSALFNGTYCLIFFLADTAFKVPIWSVLAFPLKLLESGTYLLDTSYNEKCYIGQKWHVFLQIIFWSTHPLPIQTYLTHQP